MKLQVFHLHIPYRLETQNKKTSGIILLFRVSIRSADASISLPLGEKVHELVFQIRERIRSRGWLTTSLE